MQINAIWAKCTIENAALPSSQLALKSRRRILVSVEGVILLSLSRLIIRRPDSSFHTAGSCSCRGRGHADHKQVDSPTQCLDFDNIG